MERTQSNYDHYADEFVIDEAASLRVALGNIASGSNITGLADALIQGNVSSAVAVIQQYARAILGEHKGTDNAG